MKKKTKKNNLLKFKSIVCSYYLDKEGNYLYNPIINSDCNQYYCLIKKLRYSSTMLFPNLKGKNEDDILKKLYMINKCKKLDFGYIQLGTNEIFIYNKKIRNIYEKCAIYFNAYKYIGFDTILNTYLIYFLFIRIFTNKKISNQTLLIQTFYLFFDKNYLVVKDEKVKKLKENLLKKYKIDMSKIQNYHELYLVLKKKKITDIFFKTIAPTILLIYKKTYDELKKKINIEEEIKNIKKQSNNFKNINIMKLIDELPKNYNKKYIKNKFIEMSKKYNI